MLNIVIFASQWHKKSHNLDILNTMNCEIITTDVLRRKPAIRLTKRNSFVRHSNEKKIRTCCVTHVEEKHSCGRKEVAQSRNCFYARQLYRQVLQRARIRYGHSVRLSVRLSGVSRPGTESSPGEIETPVFHRGPRTLVSNEVIWCCRVRRFPSNEGIKEGYPLKKS